MPRTLTFDEIEQRANRLISRFREPPIPVNAVASQLGLEVEPVSLTDEVSGLLVVAGDRGVIGFNRAHSSVRQRFTIAHEVGHFVLHRHDEHLFIDKACPAFFRDTTSAKGTDGRERDANAFAASLLMPASLIKKAAGRPHFELGEEGGPVDELARLFEVSDQAMTYRLLKLGILSDS